MSEVKLVRPESPNLVTERDFGKRPVLQAVNLGIDFGGLRAVDEFNMEIGPTEIAGLIGPNGAGKTTVFNMLTNVYKPTRGSILVDGMPTADKTVHEVNQMGIARTFQNIRLFNGLSVLDNVKVGLHNNHKYNMFEGIIRTPHYYKVEREMDEKALELLKIFGLDKEAMTTACNLPYGKQRKLEIARALATDPKLLLLDEPAAGMNPSETAELMENIRMVRDNYHVAILLIEHDMNLVMGICEAIAVLNYGRIIAKGTPDDIKNNPTVIEAYLGKKE